MKTFIPLFFLLSLTTACAGGPSKSELDAEVKRLCAIDGGVKVYEMVTLPAEKLDKYGKVNFHIPFIFIPYDKLDKLKDRDEYYFEWETTYLKTGNPSLQRDHVKLIRRNDQRILGESISYGRGGGDMPGPWHESTFSCPDTTKSPGLEKSIFKGDKK